MQQQVLRLYVERIGNRLVIIKTSSININLVIEKVLLI
jgi:hypothetical protein